MFHNFCRTALFFFAFACTSVLAQVCAPPALLLTAIPPGGIINDYYDGSASPTLNPGASTLVLGTRDARGYTTTMVIGDLLMVMQMQDGTTNSSNSSNYGDGSGSGNESTSVGSAGLYEFVRVTAVAGSNITFTPKLVNNYKYLNSTASTAQKSYQVVCTLQFGQKLTTTAGANSEQDYASVSTEGYHASKAEGLMGTPIILATKTNNLGLAPPTRQPVW